MHEGHRQRRPKFARGSGDCFSPSPEEGEKPSKLRFPSMKSGGGARIRPLGMIFRDASPYGKGLSRVAASLLWACVLNGMPAQGHGAFRNAHACGSCFRYRPGRRRFFFGLKSGHTCGLAAQERRLSAHFFEDAEGFFLLCGAFFDALHQKKNGFAVYDNEIPFL